MICWRIGRKFKVTKVAKVSKVVGTTTISRGLGRKRKRRGINGLKEPAQTTRGTGNKAGEILHWKLFVRADEALKKQLDSDPATKNLSGAIKAEILEQSIGRVLGNRAQDWFAIDQQWASPDIMLPEQQDQFSGEILGGLISLGINYVKMRAANVKGSDKYFHCTFHCEAASQGMGGRLASKLAAVAREQSDLTRNVSEKGLSPAASLADCLIDSWSNERGSLAGRSGERCSTSCGPPKLKGL